MEKTVGYRIKEARVAKGWQANRLAGIAGISNSQLCKYESDERIITTGDAIKICSVLEISLDWLLLGKTA